MAALADDSACQRHHLETIPFFTALMASRLHAVLSGLAPVGTTCLPSRLIETGQVAPGHRAYLDYALDFLVSMERFGTSASGSRPTSGERPPHRELERALADLHGAADCVAYVSGHATNVWTLYQLFKKRDLILHDSLAHNSIIQGGQVSEATRLSFPHNDLDALDKLLSAERRHFQRVCLVTEGLFSMSGVARASLASGHPDPIVPHRLLCT